MSIIRLIILTKILGTMATTLAGSGTSSGLVIGRIGPGRQMADR